MHSLLLYI
jgi:hypothetical protein